MTNLFQKTGFEDIEYIQPSQWDIDNEICTMDDEEKRIFNEYVFEMRNVQMCAFKMIKL